jgi:nickel-dependent lactate racemase
MLTTAQRGTGAMTYFSEESSDTGIDSQRSGVLIDGMLAAMGRLDRVLILPPDFSRRHSGAGELTVQLYERLRASAHVEIMPALGTHAPMTAEEIEAMFPGVPWSVFRVHDWRNELARLGEVPAAFVREITHGKVDFPVRCEVNRIISEGNWDRIISVGQLVPHEVAGIANHSKNVFVGVGGQDVINKTHFVGAVCGMEAAMGRTHTPVRSLFEYMAENFARDLPITYLLTVRRRNAAGATVTCGIYAGDDNECFLNGARLCRQVNLDLLDEPISKAVVYLEPGEFKSVWLGNKAIYRTRMAMADEGELIILAPGVTTFGEDPEIDQLIRKHGYRGTPRTLEAVTNDGELAANLAAAAHLIHGSSEGRFRVTYCPGGISREEIEIVGFAFAGLAGAQQQYDPAKLHDGWNDVKGERVFFISNPGLGLWALRSRFESSGTNGGAEAAHAG